MRRYLTFLAWPLLAVPQVLFYLGALLNQIAVAANKGLMPVLMSGCTVGPLGKVMNGVRVLDEMHSCMEPSSKFKILCDWINLHSSVLSIGDVLLYLGDLLIAPAFWMWLAYVLYRASRKELYRLQLPSQPRV